MGAIGRTMWVIADGHIPVDSTGPEPARTSRDEIAVLNTGDHDAEIEITVYYADREPVAGYRFAVGARRVRRVRFNDLIDPEAMPLGVDYGAVISSNVPVVVQFARVDTGSGSLALASILAYPGDD